MIGTNIKHSREKAGMSQKELADKIGTTQPRIARWEKGEVVPNAQYLAKIAASLDITIDELINGIKN